jgi:ankyrin repeat protein
VINLNQKDSEGKTSLHLACELGHKKCAALLLKNDADLFLTDNDGRTALHLAVIGNHHGIVQQLIQKGAPINIFTTINGVSNIHLSFIFE